MREKVNKTFNFETILWKNEEIIKKFCKKSQEFTKNRGIIIICYFKNGIVIQFAFLF